MSVRDKNGVLLTPGMRVEKNGREGVVGGAIGPYRVFVTWAGEHDDELESAETLVTVSAVREIRRRRR